MVSGMSRMQVGNLITILPLRVRFRFARKIYTKKILRKTHCKQRVNNAHYVFLFVVLFVGFYSLLEEESLDEVNDEGICSFTFGWICHVMPVR